MRLPGHIGWYGPALLAASLTLGCGERGMTIPADALARSFDSVPPEAWAALSTRRIYFAHQSVGGNLAQGLQALLAEHPTLPIRLVRSQHPDSVEGGAIFHDFLGENGAPMSKTDAFVQIVGRPSAAPVDVAMQKFCYADFDRHTDPDSVFAEYERRIEALRAARPELQIVHVTAPLLEQRFYLKDVARRILGKTTLGDRQEKVRQFNATLRARYSGRDPIFDLAAVEAGASSANGGGTVPGRPEALQADYATPDGGHLNTYGSKVMAVEFLRFLATLPARTVSQ